MSTLNLEGLSQEAVERIVTGCLLGAPDRAEFVLKHLQPHDFVCSRWNLVFLSATALRKTRAEAAFSAEELAADALPSAAALRSALVEELYRCKAEAEGVSVEGACKALEDRTETRWELIRVLQERNAAREKVAETQTIDGVPRLLAAAPPPCPAVCVGNQQKAESVPFDTVEINKSNTVQGAFTRLDQPAVAHQPAETPTLATPQGPSSAFSATSVVKEKCTSTESTSEIFAWSPDDLDQKIPPSEHFWHGLLAPRKVTLLYSRAKLGKSYLTFGLLSAVWKGAPFLGRPTKELIPGAPPGVVYLTEEDADTLRLKHRHFAFPAGAPICFLPKRELPYSKFTFEESLKTGFDLVRARGAKLLVLDTLSSWAGVEAGAEHFAARAEVLIKILKDGASASGAAVLVLHHSTKKGKELRGSSALEASPDALVRLSSPYESSARRFLYIKTRLAGELSTRVEFEITKTGFSTVSKGRESDLSRLMEFIPNHEPGISISELTHESEMRKSWVYEALGVLQVKGLVMIKEGNKSKYFPTRVWRNGLEQSA